MGKHQHHAAQRAQAQAEGERLGARELAPRGGAPGSALHAGVDLLLVALLQVLSYPFHDPVLTDRGFVTEEKSMLRAMIMLLLLLSSCTSTPESRLLGNDHLPRPNAGVARSGSSAG